MPNSLILRYTKTGLGSLRTAACLVACLYTALIGQEAAAVAPPPYEIEIVKSTRLLHLKRGNQIIRTFNAAFGKGLSGPKRIRGDNKTPVGEYRIVEYITDSKFHFFMQLNYPNTLDAWHGYQDQLITASEYKQIIAAIKQNLLPPQDTALGGQIGIHGIGETTDETLKIHAAVNWTEGCIALTNQDINFLRRYAVPGTRVHIIE